MRKSAGDAAHAASRRRICRRSREKSFLTARADAATCRRIRWAPEVPVRFAIFLMTYLHTMCTGTIINSDRQARRRWRRARSRNATARLSRKTMANRRNAGQGHHLIESAVCEGLFEMTFCSASL